MKHLLVGLLSGISLLSFAQTKLELIPKDSVLQIWNHESEVYHAWNSLDSTWMARDYWAILKINKLKMTCDGCEHILMHADLNVDANGRLVEYRVVRSDMCGPEFSSQLASAFMEYFFSITFPSALRNRVFRVILGTGLKC
jgi:hypothetical protein